MRAAVCGLAVALLAGCSLVGLDRFDVPACESSCEPVNARRGIAPDACMRYQCVPQGGATRCVLSPRDGDRDGHVARACGGDDCDDAQPADHPGAREACDGRDNDCDGVIDEAALRPVLGETRDGRLASTARVSWAHPARGAAHGYALGPAGMPGALEVRITPSGDASSQTATVSGAIEYAWQSDWRQPRLEPGCLDGPGCTIGDFAAARVADGAVALAVAVNTSGCAHGQLRVGVLELADAPPRFAQRAPLARSNARAGIDDRDLAAPAPPFCSGASRPAGAPRGAAAASIAWLDGTPELARGGATALAVWLADGVDRAACDNGGEVAVEALMVWSEQDSYAGQTVRAVNASDGAAPAVLGRTNAGGRPAVAPWADGRGFFVAHGTGARSVAVRFVPALPAPAPFSVEAAMRDATVPRATASLRGAAIDSFELPGAGARPDHLALAAGATDGATGAVDLALAWDQGCAGAEPGVWLAVVRYDPRPAPPASRFTVRTPPVRLGADDAPGRRPALAYVARGLLAANGARAERVTPASDGGWIVAYATARDATAPATGAEARRIDELDARLIDEPPIPLASGGVIAPDELVAYTLGADRAEAGVAWIDAARASVVYGPLRCAP